MGPVRVEKANVLLADVVEMPQIAEEVVEALSL
jgi:hypothetical protein